MFSKLFPDRLSSVWRLGILQSVLLFGTVALCIAQASWVLRRDLNSIARAVIMDDLGEYGTLYNRNELPEISHVFASGKHEDSQGVRILKPDGEVVFEQMPSELRVYSWPARPHVDRTNGKSEFITINAPGKKNKLLLGSLVLKDGNVLCFGRTDAEDLAYITRIQRKLWLAGLASAGLMLLPLWWFTKHVIGPVQKMAERVGALSRGRTDERMEAPAAVPELQSFASAYNTGLDRIAELTQELQRANDHLAHELRTPLARIRGNLEAFLDHTDNASAHEAAARGLDEIDRAADLIQTILTIRAGDHKALKLHREICNLGELLQQLFDLYQPAAEERGLRLGLEAPPSHHAWVDKQRLTQAVANLLDNALAYTPKPGSVTLALESLGSHLRIVVRDTGPGLKRDEMERIWQRHARGSAASANTPGIGLGLSLVHAIATAHDGSAGCANREERGAEFWIELPGGDPLSSANAV